MPSCENNRDELYECECDMVYKHRQILKKHQKNAENAKKCRKMPKNAEKRETYI